ncbi:MAG: hypothetical protein BGO78_03065 [Chloroflexi bacterium 44-23]|nr:MAG: hypothetical protein BGO78_03065 [Chloroflexi bacterium 44-23]
MNKLISTYGRLFAVLLFILILLNACNAPSAPISPTLDQAAVVAAAVETLRSEMTSEALLNPTVTPQPTATSQPPTSTPIPPTEIPTATTIADTATPVVSLSAKLLYVTTWPENKRIYVPNEIYGLAIGFENNGTLTWDAGSTIKLASFKGEATVQLELTVDKAVKPGEKIEYGLWTFGSETLGEHTFNFQVYTSQGIPIPGGWASYTYTSV